MGRGRPVGSLLALAMLAAVCASGIPGADAQDDASGSLWFTVRDGTPARTFTSLPPSVGDTGESLLAAPVGVSGEWQWELPVVDLPWSVPAETEWRAVLYLSGLDELLPTGDPATEPDAAGWIRIRATLHRGGPVVATGALDLTVLEVEAGPAAYEVAFAFEQPFSAAAGEVGLELRLRVTGRTLSGPSSAVLHFGAPEAPSALVAPAFPVESLREGDLEYAAERECRLLLLEQKPCPGEETEPEEPPPGQEAAAIAMTPLLVLLTVALLAARRAGVSRSGRS